MSKPTIARRVFPVERLVSPGEDLPDSVLRQCTRDFVEQNFGKERVELVFSNAPPTVKSPPIKRSAHNRQAVIDNPLRRLKAQLETAKCKVRNLERRIADREANAEVKGRGMRSEAEHGASP